MARPSGQKHPRVVEKDHPVAQAIHSCSGTRRFAQPSRWDQSADAHPARIVWRGMTGGDPDVHIARIGPEGRVSLERIR
jgi:hypothetical protein